jgi:anti-sigma regulatory factor (Ser/Thr protein kinase)
MRLVARSSLVQVLGVEGEMAGPAAVSRSLRHLAMLHHGQPGHVPALWGIVRDSLDRDEGVLVAVPDASAEHLRTVLSAESSRVTWMDMTSLGRNPARIIPAVLTFVTQCQGRKVTCITEPVWPGRSAGERQEAARHEALVNLAFRDVPATIVCLYDTAALPRLVMADAAATHPVILSEGREHASASYREPATPPAHCNRMLAPPPPQSGELRYHRDLRPVRSFVAKAAQQAGLSSSRAADLVLAISELAANTLRHTRAGGTLHVWRSSGALICQVHDTGQITDPLAGRRFQSADTPGGKGLWLVNQVCDLVQIRTREGSTTIRLHMRLAQP